MSLPINRARLRNMLRFFFTIVYHCIQPLPGLILWYSVGLTLYLEVLEN